MSLYIVSTPIGNPQDITLRAIELLKSAELIIGEEFKEVTTLLKRHQATGKKIELLNEHSKPHDLEFYLEECKTKQVVLVSDCGTPGFCDPGADLVALCRKNNIDVIAVPGASSLMTFLSLTGKQYRQFVFRGFLPKETEERAIELKKLKTEKRAVLLMDTPYRLNKLLTEIKENLPTRRCILGVDLTMESEKLLIGTAGEIQKKLGEIKAEFMLMLDEEK